MKTFRLQESKTTLLKKLLNNGNITEEQFHIADDFFKRHNAFEKEIDWNRGLNITWDELSSVIYKERNSKSQAKKKIRKGLEGFTEGKDYLVIAEGEYNGEPWTAYQPFTWEASRMIASHYVEPTEGYNGTLDAQWCTAYQKDKDYWDSHNEFEAFLYLCGETIPTKKVAISISEEGYDASGSEFLYSTDSLNYNIWDFYDSSRGIKYFELQKIIPNLNELIEKAYKNWKESYKFLFHFNTETHRYDCTFSLSPLELRKFIKPDKEGFIIDFGVINGDFDCSNLELISLEGAPTEVEGSFYCYNNLITSLKGAPQIVRGSFLCYRDELTSLEGAPQEVGGNFNCAKNKLTSLEGAPQKVGGNFWCNYNPNLHSLEGIGEVKGRIYKDY